MTPMTSASSPRGEEPRWFAHRRGGALSARKAKVTADGRSFQAIFRRCAEGGYVVTLPAIPHLSTRGASYQHARAAAVVLVDAYLRELRAAGRIAADRPDRRSQRLPLAA